MKSVFVSLASVSLFAAGVLGQSLQINTPASAVECQPTLLSWSGGTPPYFLRYASAVMCHLQPTYIFIPFSVLPGNSPSSPALQDLGTQTGTSFTWSTNITADTSVGLTLKDSTGAIAQSAAFTIQAGSSSCIGGSSSSTAAGSSGSTSATTSAGTTSSSSSSAAATTSSASKASSASVTTSSAAGSGSSSASKTGSSTSAAASSSGSASSSSSAGFTNGVNYGVAAVAAAVFAMLG
ncbi:hypothetical protein PLICRDRAFT_178774 [Plicaturopsis crispa FD-325 SS-3]|uniref:Uncharacterized protein n=1 Tax=Plicaturopsis crispa FD-325 SS-3 TaxID=944288 RepID=A0A0C9T6P3_PLICR|nr:hypothetical protein PLICRDRAFT_178774 [Plicaturopsis crispa FD-325 SS-3]